MRLEILHHGHRPLQKMQMALMRALTGAVPGPVSVMSYRRDLFGKHMAACLQEAMRGPSPWSVAEREIFAAFVSKLNQCEY